MEKKVQCKREGQNGTDQTENEGARLGMSKWYKIKRPKRTSMHGAKGLNMAIKDWFLGMAPLCQAALKI